MPNWQSLEAKNRLLAAILAAHNDKKLLDYRKIATYYGEGATYDSIEGQFRKIRVEAAKMKEEVDSGIRAQAPPRGTTAPKTEHDGLATPKRAQKPRSSPKKRDGVLSGRVNKSVTPTKKRGAGNAVKGVKEEMESSASSMMDDVLGGQVDGSDEAFEWLNGQDAYGDMGGLDGELSFTEV